MRFQPSGQAAFFEGRPRSRAAWGRACWKWRPEARRGCSTSNLPSARYAWRWRTHTGPSRFPHISSVHINVFETADETAVAVARHIAARIDERPNLVLGLPTGRTPVAIYAELRRLHAASRTDFSRIVTFNLDEFDGISAAKRGSFRPSMEDHLFHALGLPAAHVHFLAGDAEDLGAECDRYETAIAAAGGIDLPVLGGRAPR